MSDGFVGVVLCGGRSHRMGRDKALAHFAGRALVHVAVDAMVAAGAVSVTSVGGNRAALTELGIAVVEDRYPDEGPLGAIITALTDVTAHAADLPVMIVTCDLVAVTGIEVRRIVDELIADPFADVAAPIIDDRPQYLTGAYRRRAAPLLQHRFDAGERAVRRAGAALTLARVEGLDPARLADADTPEDLARAAKGGSSG